MLSAVHPLFQQVSTLVRKSRRYTRFLKRYIEGYLQKGRFVAPKAPRVSIETTNICNAKCVFCANPIMKRRKEPLKFDLFKKVVDEAAAMGSTEIDFNAVIGDPLLDPSLLERAKYVRQFPQFKELGFITTLQWLHRWTLEEFFAAGFTWLSVSMTLSGREKYLEFFGVDKYDQALKNLIDLITENKKRGAPISIFIGLKPTNETVESVIQHPDFLRIKELTGNDYEPQLRESEFAHVDDWLGQVELPSYLRRRPLVPRFFRPCRLLYSGVVIYSNGKVGACSCRDFEADSDLVLGDSKEQTIPEIWNGKKIASLRDNWRLKNQVPDICKSCRHYMY